MIDDPLPFGFAVQARDDGHALRVGDEVGVDPRGSTSTSRVARSTTAARKVMSWTAPGERLIAAGVTPWKRSTAMWISTGRARRGGGRVPHAFGHDGGDLRPAVARRLPVPDDVGEGDEDVVLADRAAVVGDGADVHHAPVAACLRRYGVG
jgi:hypothetical protein